MIPPDDFPGDMDRFPFDDSDAEAVFGSSCGTDAVPEDLRDVADLVHAARRTGSTDELVGEDVIVAQLAAAIGEHAALLPGDADERISVLRKFRTAKLTAAATAVLMLGGTAAAAATGSLPAPVQSSVAKGLSGVGISLPAHHHASLAAEHKSISETPKVHHHRRARHMSGASGTVASVGGVSVADTCGSGTVDTAGTFTLTGRKGATFTVNVDTTTTYLDEGVAGPSFANVCVGSLVHAKGTVAEQIVTATKIVIKPPRPPHVPKAAFGTVASVNGSSVADRCGTGTAGLFTLTANEDKTFTVTVDATTAYLQIGVRRPSFANVCVGSFVLAKGTVVDPNVTATKVFIAPIRPKHEKSEHKRRHVVFGTVASVNGNTTAGACGTADMRGTFALSGHKDETFTVNVDSSTKFFAPGVDDPSFAKVCVGSKVGANGDVTDSTIAATVAFIAPARDGEHKGDTHDGEKHGKKLERHNGRNHHAKGDDSKPEQEHTR